MNAKELQLAGLDVVSTRRWDRLNSRFSATSITTKKVTTGSVDEAINIDGIGAWVRLNGETWLTNPLGDEFVIGVECAARSKVQRAAQLAARGLADTLAAHYGAEVVKGAVDLWDKPEATEDAEGEEAPEAEPVAEEEAPCEDISEEAAAEEDEA